MYLTSLLNGLVNYNKLAYLAHRQVCINIICESERVDRSTDTSKCQPTVQTFNPHSLTLIQDFVIVETGTTFHVILNYFAIGKLNR